MINELDELDTKRHEAIDKARTEIEQCIRKLGYRLWQSSTGSLRRVRAYENQVGDEVLLIVEYTNYDKIHFDISAKSTDPALTKQLQPFLKDAKKASAEYAKLLSHYRTIEELSA